MGQYLNPPRVKKKNLIPVKNPFIKFQPRPIRGGAGRVPEKTRPVAIPNVNHKAFSQPKYFMYLSFKNIFKFMQRNIEKKKVMVLHKIVKFALSKPRVINHRTVIVELVS